MIELVHHGKQKHFMFCLENLCTSKYTTAYIQILPDLRGPTCCQFSENQLSLVPAFATSCQSSCLPWTTPHRRAEVSKHQDNETYSPYTGQNSGDFSQDEEDLFERYYYPSSLKKPVAILEKTEEGKISPQISLLSGHPSTKPPCHIFYLEDYLGTTKIRNLCSFHFCAVLKKKIY